MATTEERLQILKMIEEGKISASEGAELLRAVDHSKGSDAAAPLRGASDARWFRVRVTDTRSGRTKINVNIPIGLVNVGIKMGARFAPELDQGQYNHLLEAIRGGRQGKVIDIEEEGEHVEIFVE
ncbi:MAG: hypothetical protein IPL78_22095 [Chloroflexi bacterium]|nr:hypothetical protein [Chloroflexota bacterium]